MPESLIDLCQIETTTACPAECPMCPRDIQKRGHGVMTDANFWSAVNGAVDCGAETIVPFIDGEPLTDSRIPRFIEEIKNRYPDVDVVIYTNAVLLTRQIATRLLSAGNIKDFNVSMQGGTKEVYERNMRLPWDRVVGNVKMLLDVNRELGEPSTIRLNMCVFSKTVDTVDAFRAMWEPLGAMICLGAYSNFGGMVHDEYGEAPWYDKPRLVCDRATEHAYVYWNGDVGQCCFDLLGTVTYGNIQESSLRDILTSEKLSAMRRAHYAIDVANMPKICHECNSCKFDG